MFMKIGATELYAGQIATAKILRQKQLWCLQEDWFSWVGEDEAEPAAL